MRNGARKWIACAKSTEASIAQGGPEQIRKRGHNMALTTCKECGKALAPEFQVLITEHADLADAAYQDAVVERWRGGMKLVGSGR